MCIAAIARTRRRTWFRPSIYTFLAELFPVPNLVTTGTDDYRPGSLATAPSYWWTFKSFRYSALGTTPHAPGAEYANTARRWTTRRRAAGVQKKGGIFRTGGCGANHCSLSWRHPFDRSSERRSTIALPGPISSSRWTRHCGAIPRTNFLACVLGSGRHPYNILWKLQ